LTRLETYSYRTITTDLGGELAKSRAFQLMLVEPEIGYMLKTTGAHSSAQNGLAEKPNQDLAQMMRLMLYGAGLGSEYWAYALRHMVYIKNCTPHTSLQYTTPYEKYATGFDIYSYDETRIKPGEQMKLGTKIALEIQDRYHGQLLVRSSYASKYRA
jgi:hypothetical protein